MIIISEVESNEQMLHNCTLNHIIAGTPIHFFI